MVWNQNALPVHSVWPARGATQWIGFSKMGYRVMQTNNMLHYKSNKILFQVVLIVPND